MHLEEGGAVAVELGQRMSDCIVVFNIRLRLHLRALCLVRIILSTTLVCGLVCDLLTRLLPQFRGGICRIAVDLDELVDGP